MNFAAWLEEELQDPEFRREWESGEPEMGPRIKAAKRRLERRAFWGGFRRGWLWGNAIGLPPFFVWVLGHYAGWWR